MSFDEIADRLIDWACTDARVQALWIEAATTSTLRRPYAQLEVHLAADEPDYPGVLLELRQGMKALPNAKVLSSVETQRFARELRLEVDGQALVLIAEQSNLLAKRPRAAVVVLVDKTLHLPHVFDYSKRA